MAMVLLPDIDFIYELIRIIPSLHFTFIGFYAFWFYRNLYVIFSQFNYGFTQPTSIFMEQLWDIGIGEI